MSSRCLSRSLRAQITQAAIRPSTLFFLHFHRRSSTLAVPPVPDSYLQLSSISSGTLSSADYHKDIRLSTLIDALSNQTPPNQVWLAYISVVGVAGADSVPLETHQQVLRLCCPSLAALRGAVIKKLQRGRLPEPTDVPEGRLISILQNIRSMNLQPTLDDFNFILQRFAVVGHYQGCWEVYKELKRLGITPSQATYGYCFQSIAYRFALPIPKGVRETLLVVTQDMFSNYAADMRQFKVPMNPVTFDLSIRILKETLDQEAFENLMKWGYGLDLSHPDHVALEFSSFSDLETQVTPFPFTTTALNTTLDVLGRLGNISKMVQAFEVLTQPLPNASEHQFNSFESDENDDFGVKFDLRSSTRFSLPHAVPNSTTYKTMIRYISRADHAVFARHYVNHARMLDRHTSHNLRNVVQSLYAKGMPLDGVPSPRMTFSAGMLLPVLGAANKDKNLGLLKWLQSKMPYHLRVCRNDLVYYFNLLGEVKRQRVQEVEPPILVKPLPTPVLDLNVEDPPPPEGRTTKFFNLDLHVEILKQNYMHLEKFGKRLEFMFSRTHERVKERLGRRVWSRKDVYFSDDSRRKVVSKQQWREVVNFKPRTDTYQHKINSRPWLPPKLERRPRRMISDRVSFLSRPFTSAPTVS